VNHGTVSGYTSFACRCDACRRAAVRYTKQWRVDRLAGKTRKVDATPAHDHLRMLMAAGMTPNAICAAAGWKSRNSIASVLNQSQVTRPMMAKVLAIPLGDSRPNGYTDATGTRRRLQALSANGWPSRRIAAEAGLDHATVLDIQSGQKATVRRATASAIADAYDRLWATDGGSTKTRRWAARQGFAVPLAWDDDTLDDPAATPHVEQRQDTVSRRREHVIEDFLDTRDHHDGDLRLAAERLGMTWAALTQALVRANRDGAGITFHNVYTSRDRSAT
jgi:hypothetical protein